MIRTGMQNVIAKLRNEAQVGASDYTIGNATYWSDAQLQDKLDEHRTDVFMMETRARPRVSAGGTGLYYDYYFPNGNWEEGTASFIVQNSTGGTPDPNGYSVNYRAGHIAFTSDQRGTAFYITARQYDINSAAADVWRSKAANVAQYYDFSADGHSMSRSQMQKQYIEMANHYASQSGLTSATMYRGDVNASGDEEDD